MSAPWRSPGEVLTELPQAVAPGRAHRGNNNTCLLPSGVVRNNSVRLGKTLKMPRTYFKLISLNILLGVFNIQKRKLGAAEAIFFLNPFFFKEKNSYAL